MLSGLTKATVFLLADTVLSLTLPPFLNNPSQRLLGSSHSTQQQSSPKLFLPPQDSIICPSTDAIIPIYGPPSQHHSYLTAVTTFCRIDLAHIPHGAPNTNSAAPPTHDLNGEALSPDNQNSRVAVVPNSPLTRSYRVTLLADTDGENGDSTTASNRYTLDNLIRLPSNRPSKAPRRNGKLPPNAATHLPESHQLSLEIRNENDHAVTISSEDCVASFMAIVDAANGCRVSDVLTKPGEYRVGTSDDRGLAGLVFRAVQWK